MKKAHCFIRDWDGSLNSNNSSKMKILILSLLQRWPVVCKYCNNTRTFNFEIWSLFNFATVSDLVHNMLNNFLHYQSWNIRLLYYYDLTLFQMDYWSKLIILISQSQLTNFLGISCWGSQKGWKTILDVFLDLFSFVHFFC